MACTVNVADYDSKKASYKKVDFETATSTVLNMR